jgi:hypothetical protein
MGFKKEEEEEGCKMNRKERGSGVWDEKAMETFRVEEGLACRKCLATRGVANSQSSLVPYDVGCEA